MGQTCQVDCQQQALFAQRPLANPDTTSVRRVQTKRVYQHLRRYRTKCVFHFRRRRRIPTQFLIDVFQPLFEVTRDPSSHPELHVFLQRVIGFDTVDDESKAERRFHKKFPYPRLWDAKESPPYSYWYANYFLSRRASHMPRFGRVYYMYANIVSLNQWRRARGFCKFSMKSDVGGARGLLSFQAHSFFGPTVARPATPNISLLPS